MVNGVIYLYKKRLSACCRKINSSSERCCESCYDFCYENTKFEIACVMITMISGILVLVTAICLLATVPAALPSGEVLTVGSSDVVLVSSFNSRNIGKVNFIRVNEAANEINLYQDACSEIQNFTMNLNSMRQLNISNDMQYRIDEVHLIRGSKIQYNFSNSEMEISSKYVANISVFSAYNDYKEFLKNGRTTNANTYCLPSASAVEIGISTSNHDMNFFVGLKSFESVQLDYTTAEDLVQYNITNLTATSCLFSTSSCSLTINSSSGAQDICVLVSSLQPSNAVTILRYSTDHTLLLRLQTAFGWTMFSFSIGLFLVLFLHLTKRFCC